MEAVNLAKNASNMERYSMTPNMGKLSSNNSKNQTNNITVKIDSPITVSGAGSPEEVGASIVDQLSTGFHSALNKASSSNRLVTEY